MSDETRGEPLPEVENPFAEESPRSSLPTYLTPEELATNEDYEWALHDPEVRRQYGGQVVVVHQRRIWGAGKNHETAHHAAVQQPGCPEKWHLAFVPIPPLPRVVTSNEA
jgi:hypothetical protein